MRTMIISEEWPGKDNWMKKKPLGMGDLLGRTSERHYNKQTCIEKILDNLSPNDEESIAKIGQFPWRRDIYSKILSNLIKFGISSLILVISLSMLRSFKSEGLVGLSFDIPIISAPKRCIQNVSHVPLKPVCPEIITTLFLKIFFIS